VNTWDLRSVRLPARVMMHLAVHCRQRTAVHMCMYVFIYACKGDLFIVYLTTLSVAQTIVSNERRYIH
jgi:hypothetical protein